METETITLGELATELNRTFGTLQSWAAGAGYKLYQSEDVGAEVADFLRAESANRPRRRRKKQTAEAKGERLTYLTSVGVPPAFVALCKLRGENPEYALERYAADAARKALALVGVAE